MSKRSKTFGQRLAACQQAGNLTVADLARWFARPYPTVRTWVENGIEPGGGPIDKDYAAHLLSRLETLVRKKQGFPIPRLPPSERIAHLKQIRAGV